MALTLNKLPWYGQVGLFAVIAVALAGLFYNFYVAPFEADIATRQQQDDTLRAEINRALGMAQRLPEFRAQIGDLEKRLQDLKNVLPEQKDVSGLLRRIQTLATQSSLTIRAFKPKPIANKQIHAEWPIALELDGTYHNLGMFFDRVSKLSRIINISELNIKGKEKPSDVSTISTDCTATTFVLLETPQKPATPGAAAPTTVAAR